MFCIRSQSTTGGPPLSQAVLPSLIDPLTRLSGSRQTASLPVDVSGQLEPGWREKKKGENLQSAAPACDNHCEIIAITVHFPSLQRHTATY